MQSLFTLQKHFQRSGESIEPGLPDHPIRLSKAYKRMYRFVLPRSDGPEPGVTFSAELLSARLPDQILGSLGLRRPDKGAGSRGAKTGGISRVKVRTEEHFW